MNGTNYLGGVNAGSVNMFKNKYLRRAVNTQIKNCWSLDKPMASLSTCHLGLCLVWQSF